MIFDKKKETSAHDFEICVFRFLEKYITAKEPVRALFDTAAILAKSPHDELHQEWAAELYFNLEQYIGNEQTKERLGKEELRAKIEKSCKPESVHSVFSLLFLPKYLRKIRVFEEYIDQLFRGVSEDAIKDFLKDNVLAWQDFEKSFSSLGPKEQEEQALQNLKRLLKEFHAFLAGRVSPMRANILIEDAYRIFLKKLHIIEEASLALLIIPEDLLIEERRTLLSKESLEKEVRERNRELEIALAELRGEKEKLDKALDELAIRSQATEDFVRVVSHQFRTPLSIIRWNTEILEGRIKELPVGQIKEIDEVVQDISNKSRFLIYVLEDIFDVLAIEDGSSQINKKPSQLWEIAAEVVSDYEKTAVQKGVSLIFDKKNVPVEELLLEPGKIKRVIEILLRNAIQYTEKGGSVEIIIAKTELDGKAALSLSVKDSGIGILSDDINRIFTKFYRAENATKTVPDGAGLGLYLVKRFAEAHGGEIRVESELGRGSKFTITFPKE